MLPRKLILSSSTLLGTALFLTMVYSLIQILSATDAAIPSEEAADVGGAPPSIASSVSGVPDAASPVANVPPDPAIETAVSSTSADNPDVPSVTSAAAAPPSDQMPPPFLPGPAAVVAAEEPPPAVAPPTTAPTVNSFEPPPPTIVPATVVPATAVPISAPEQQTALAPVPTATPRPAARLSAASAGVETVRFVKELNAGAIIVFRGSDLWMVEHEASCSGLDVVIGGPVLLYSSGGFSSTSRIVLPDAPRDCTVTSISPI